jgi:hypothetical protein
MSIKFYEVSEKVREFGRESSPACLPDRVYPSLFKEAKTKIKVPLTRGIQGVVPQISKIHRIEDP